MVAKELIEYDKGEKKKEKEKQHTQKKKKKRKKEKKNTEILQWVYDIIKFYFYLIRLLIVNILRILFFYRCGNSLTANMYRGKKSPLR